MNLRSMAEWDALWDAGWDQGPIEACVACGQGVALRDPSGRPRHARCEGREPGARVVAPLPLETWTCSCGRAVEWIVTSAGKRMPLDPEPIYVTVDPKGPLVVVLRTGAVKRARRRHVGEDGLHVDAKDVEEARVSHFATCPEADEFRKRRPSR